MLRRHRSVLLLAASSVAALAWAAFAAPRDLLLYNHSPSVPEGFYVRTRAPIIIGTFVTVRARDVAPEEARRRRFAGPTDRFIKRIAAVGGERVCGDGQRVIVGNGAIVVSVLGTGGQHEDHINNDRAAPVGWRGCRVLNADEVLLLGDTPDSFDGRYWGPVSTRLIEGVWRRL